MRVERLPREPAEADIDAVMALETDSFTNPWSRESLVWELQNSDVTRAYLLRDDDERAVAFCLCWVLFDELHINTLAVARRLGFRVAARRPRYYSKPDEDGLILWKEQIDASP